MYAVLVGARNHISLITIFGWFVIVRELNVPPYRHAASVKNTYTSCYTGGVGKGSQGELMPTKNLDQLKQVRFQQTSNKG